MLLVVKGSMNQNWAKPWLEEFYSTWGFRTFRLYGLLTILKMSCAGHVLGTCIATTLPVAILST